jgi:recombinational DNA repair protein RecR
MTEWEEEEIEEIEEEIDKLCPEIATCEDCIPEICGEDECERICEEEMEMTEWEEWEEEE